MQHAVERQIREVRGRSPGLGNGIGIAEDKIDKKKSFGIISMKERAASLGGSLKIYRTSDNLTVIGLIFPLNNNGIDENPNL